MNERGARLRAERSIGKEVLACAEQVHQQPDQTIALTIADDQGTEGAVALVCSPAVAELILEGLELYNAALAEAARYEDN